jgi:hypothetical protein
MKDHEIDQLADETPQRHFWAKNKNCLIFQNYQKMPTLIFADSHDISSYQHFC